MNHIHHQPPENNRSSVVREAEEAFFLFMRRNSPESQEMSLNTGIMVPIALWYRYILQRRHVECSINRVFWNFSPFAELFGK